MRPPEPLRPNYWRAPERPVSERAVRDRNGNTTDSVDSQLREPPKPEETSDLTSSGVSLELSARSGDSNVLMLVNQGWC